MRSDRIDFHHHAVPEIYRATLAKAGITEIGGVPLPDWTAEGMLNGLDTLGIAKALVSISAPGVYFGDTALAVDLAIKTNDALADLRAEWPTRVGGLASLPLPSVDASLREIDRISELGLDGVCLMTNYGGKYVGNKDFAPVLEELDRRAMVVFLHPSLPTGVETLGLALPAPVLEFVFETTRCVADLIFTGVLDSVPRIKLVTSHLGGALPYIAWRLSMIEASPRPVYASFRERGRPVSDYLRSIYYDTALSAGAGALMAAADVVGADRLVFGSDVPFAPFDFVQATTQNLDACDGFTSEQQDDIAFQTAARLLAAV